MGDLAKIFWSGRSQAVRLPKEYRFEGKEVQIWREGERVFLAPIEGAEPTTLADEAAQEIDRLRSLIQEGVDSGEAEPLDMEAIKQEARRRFPPGD